MIRSRKRKEPSAQRAAAVGRATDPPTWIRYRLILAVMIVCGLGLGLGVAAWALARDRRPTRYGYEVVNVYPHDQQAYCQGLAYADGTLYEGTGKYGESTLRKVDLETGKVLQQVPLNHRLFGEGITIWKDRIVQLTWMSRVGIVYDKESFSEVRRFAVSGQGWGLTHDGRHLIMSDGTATLRFLDPQDYRVVRQLTVRSQGRRVANLNELEYVDGAILANVWRRDEIVRISPHTGDVTARMELGGLLSRTQRLDPDAVLNGIAYDEENERLFVTGKNWPKLFEIRFKPKR